MCINHIWYQKNILKYFLLPFSFIYRTIISIRHFLYQKNIFKSYKINIPVIIVGNITVGGTGKTPLVIALAKALQQNGFHPGIISRGYGGKSKKWPVFVDKNSDPILVGDEAVLMAKSTGLPVVVGPCRVASARALQGAANIILSDDGLQHYALKRDIEIAVIDSTRRFGNGFCLPAGPLREPVSRLKSADFIVINNNFLIPTPTHTHTPTVAMYFTIDDIVNVIDENKKINVPELKNKKIMAVAAIGNPERFFNSLRSLNIFFETKIFPDHYFFEKKDFELIKSDIILMTEKDAVKCAAFSDDRFYMVRGHVELDSSFINQITDRLK